MPAGEATLATGRGRLQPDARQAPESVVIVGNGSAATVQIRSETLDSGETAKLREALFAKFSPRGSDGQPSAQAISDSAVSETWGGQIANRQALALLVFVVIVAIYIGVRYEALHGDRRPGHHVLRPW